MLDSLKARVDERASDVEVKDVDKYAFLTKALKGWMNEWPNQPGKNDVLRASSMFGLCPRTFVLNYWQPKAYKGFDWKSLIRMQIGTDLHHYLQNKILGPMGVLWGEWIEQKSVVGSRKHVVGFHPDPEKAIHEVVHQQSLTWIYKEANVWDKHWRISGHLDGYLDSQRIKAFFDMKKAFKEDPMHVMKIIYGMKPGRRILLEIKTAGEYAFKGIDSLYPNRTLPDYYKMQANVYHSLSGVHETLYWYISRDTIESKVFVYEYEKGWWNDAKRKAKIVWEAIRDETLPESMMKCSLPKDKRAKECAFKDECWGMLAFKEYVAQGKKQAAKEGRELLDLKGWEA